MKKQKNPEIALKELQGRRKDAQDVLEHITALLSKADSRRLADPEGQRRWNNVLDRLERSLDEARARVERIDFLVGQTQAVLDGRDTAPPSRADEYLDPQLDSDFQLSQDPGEAMSQVLAMSLSDLSKLTMEQVALLHAQLPEQDIDIASAETQRAEARIELANQVRRRSETDGQRSLSITERRHQYILRAALQKTRTGRLSDVTREEKRLLSSCYEMLARRLEPDARDERLKNMLRQALDTLGIQHN
ncbi:MAG: hypothetical protein KA184_19570 [Candidatus Hydrogenedentes bacterium]|nr:hypothetical protein [Candidatus Hydrogenedentota bacterium]